MHSQYHISISSFQLPQLCILLLYINTIRGFLQAQDMEFSLAHTETYMGKGTSCVQVRHINVHTIQTTQLATYIKTCIHTCTYILYHENNSFKMYLQTIYNTIHLNGIIIVLYTQYYTLLYILQRILTSRYYNKYHSCIIIYMNSI